MGNMFNKATFMRQDLALIALLLMIVLVMIIPLPTGLIDTLIVVNISLTVAILVVAIYLKQPEEFSVFPAILLLGTIFRLAISISTTRMILAKADAGQIVDTFGNLVISGSIIIGLVVFLIITTVQFVVVTKGSERVAEVAARFTLDALPGRQMSIDAELRAGDIDKAEATRLRRQLEKQNQFFGAMDGAMKFVKGDAIAGLIIIVINLLGGIAIGMSEHGLTAGEAANLYSRLTVGDGLVAQLPALVFSIAAGTVITRVTTDKGSDLGTDIFTQIGGDPKTLIVTGAAIMVVGFVPGFPTFMFILAGSLFIGIGIHKMLKKRAEEQAGESGLANATEIGSEASQNIRATDNDLFRIIVSPEFFANLDIKAFAEAREIALQKNSADVGVHLTSFGFDVMPDAQDGQLTLTLDGISVFSAAIPKGLSVAQCDPDILRMTDLPIVPLDRVWPMSSAHWVDPEKTERLQQAGETVKSVETLIADVAAHFARINAAKIIGFDVVQDIQRQHAVDHQQVATQIAQTFSVVQLLNVFRNLLNEGVPLKPRRILFEALLEASVVNSETEHLTETVRIALARQICARYADHNRVIAGFLLDPSMEYSLKSELNIDQAGIVTMPGELVERILSDCQRLVGREEINSVPPALIVPRELRIPIARFLRQNRIELAVLSFREISREFVINPIGMIGEEQTEQQNPEFDQDAA